MQSGADLTLIKTLALPRTHDIPTASRQIIDSEFICQRNRAACLLDLAHHRIFNRSRNRYRFVAVLRLFLSHPRAPTVRHQARRLGALWERLWRQRQFCLGLGQRQLQQPHHQTTAPGARARPIMADARSQTEYGTVRGDLACRVEHQQHRSFDNAGNTFSAILAFIQPAGSTFGLAQSFSSTPSIARRRRRTRACSGDFPPATAAGRLWWLHRPVRQWPVSDSRSRNVLCIIDPRRKISALRRARSIWVPFGCPGAGAYGGFQAPESSVTCARPGLALRPNHGRPASG